MQNNSIQLSESQKTLSSQEAVQLAQRKFPLTISLSDEIGNTINGFILRYCVAQKIFRNEEDFLNTLDQEVSAFLIKKAEEADESEGSSEEEIEALAEKIDSPIVSEHEGNLFGPTEEKDTQGTFVLFRVFSHDELVELKETIGKTGLPIFHHSPTQKGKSEKFFAENKEYLKAVWLSKGKRSKQQPTILRVAFQANVLTEVLLNSLYASVNQGAAGEDDIKHLTLARSQSPTPILIKRESPKDKKSLKYSSRTFGFRKEIDGKETGIFTLLAKYITSVNIVE